MDKISVNHEFYNEDKSISFSKVMSFMLVSCFEQIDRVTSDKVDLFFYIL